MIRYQAEERFISILHVLRRLKSWLTRRRQALTEEKALATLRMLATGGVRLYWDRTFQHLRTPVSLPFGL